MLILMLFWVIFNCYWMVLIVVYLIKFLRNKVWVVNKNNFLIYLIYKIIFRFLMILWVMVLICLYFYIDFDFVIFIKIEFLNWLIGI